MILLLSSSVGCIGVSADDAPEPPLVLAFHAEGCGACKKDQSVIIVLEESGEYRFLVLDYDKHSDLVKKHHIKRVPTYVVLDDYGNEVSRTHRIEDLE